MFPKKLRNKLGKLNILAPFRNFIFRNKTSYREVSTTISRKYLNEFISFKFFGSIQIVAKASAKGVENTLLNNSLILLEKYKSHSQDCVVFDVGANFGFLSLVWAKTACNNNGSVYSFEPNIYIKNSFVKSINANRLNHIVNANHLAVGKENKTIELHLSSTTSNVLKSGASLHVTEVEMVTVDAFSESNDIKKCDLIKIDVDGIELEILEGSIQTLNKFKPIFVVETNNNDQIFEFFVKHNYKVLDMKLEAYEGLGELPENIFCVPNR